MKLFLFFFIAAFVLIGCAKENSDVFTVYPGNPVNDTSWAAQPAANDPAVQLHALFAAPATVDSFNATSTSFLHLSDDLDVTIPANTCVNTDGSAVLGKIRLEVNHLQSNGDFIRYGRPTTSYGKILESGGAFYIKAYKENRELTLQPGKQVVLTVKDAAPVNNMKVFVEATRLQSPLPAGTNPFYTWVPALDSSRVTTFTRQDSTGVIKGYTLFSRNLNWVNFQRFIDSTAPRTTITATLPGNFTNKNTAVFAVFKNRKSVIQLNTDYSNRAFSAPNVPVGSNVLIVSLSLIGDQLYLGVKDYTVDQVPIVMISPVKESLVQVNKFLDSL